MSKRSRIRKPASSVALARSTPSQVAVAAFLRSGSGKHGKVGKSANRASRKAARQQLRRGDWD